MQYTLRSLAFMAFAAATPVQERLTGAAGLYNVLSEIDEFTSNLIHHDYAINCPVSPSSAYRQAQINDLYIYGASTLDTAKASPSACRLQPRSSNLTPSTSALH